MRYGKELKYLSASAVMIGNEENRIKREKHARENVQLGPRFRFIHEVFDEKVELNEAIEHILRDFPSYSREVVLNWYYAEKENRTNLRESRDDDGER